MLVAKLIYEVVWALRKEENMKQILAFGDSNTWGLIPGTSPYERYPRGVRWTSILEKRLGNVHVVEDGLCGRTTTFEDEYRPGRKGICSLSATLKDYSSLDFAILMLGTNDCKSFFNLSAGAIGKGIEECLDVLEKYLEPQRILLISPLNLGKDVWREDKDPDFSIKSVTVSRQLKDVYRDIARKKGVNFMAASDVVEPSEIDNEHMDAESHRKFANAVAEKLALLVNTPS